LRSQKQEETIIKVTKSSWTEKGRVEDICSVGTGENDHSLSGRIESVHLDQNLVQGVFTLIISSHSGIAGRENYNPGRRN